MNEVSIELYEMTSSSTASTSHYSCLYSKHKTQKRKVWQDGKLTITSTGTVSLTPLTNNSNTPSIIGASIKTGQSVNHALDSVVISLNEVQQIKNGNVTDLETEKFLVQIEGLYKEPQKKTTPVQEREQVHSNNNAGNTKKLVSNRMQKLMSRKFKVPQKVMMQQQPLRQQHNQLQQNHQQQHRVMKNRKRPLQPGEWARQCQMKMMNENAQNAQNANPPNTSVNHYNQSRDGSPTQNLSLSSSYNHHKRWNHPPVQHSNPNPSLHHQQHPNTHQTYNTINMNPFQRPQHQQQPPMSSKSTILERKNISSNNANGFTSNDFDPTSFYGNDGDDDEEDNDDNESRHSDDQNYAVHENVSSNNTNKKNMDGGNPMNETHQSHYSSTQPNNNCIDQEDSSCNNLNINKNNINNDNHYPMQEEQTCSSSNQTMAKNHDNSPSQTANNTNNNSFLSRSDLLKLFTKNDSNDDDKGKNENNTNSNDYTKERNENNEKDDHNLHPYPSEKEHDHNDVDHKPSSPKISQEQQQQPRNTFLDNLLQSEAEIDGALTTETNNQQPGSSTATNCNRGSRRGSDTMNENNDNDWNHDSNNNLWYEGDNFGDNSDNDFDDDEDDENDNDDKNNGESAESERSSSDRVEMCGAVGMSSSSNQGGKQESKSVSPSTDGPFTFDINVPSGSDSSSEDDEDSEDT